MDSLTLHNAVTFRTVRVAMEETDPDKRSRILGAIQRHPRRRKGPEYKPGKKITSISQVHEGDLLIGESKTLPGVKSLVRVTDVGDDEFSILFVDPRDPSQKRKPSDRPRSIPVGQISKGQFSEARTGSVNIVLYEAVR